MPALGKPAMPQAVKIDIAIGKDLGDAIASPITSNLGFLGFGIGNGRRPIAREHHADEDGHGCAPESPLPGRLVFSGVLDPVQEQPHQPGRNQPGPVMKGQLITRECEAHDSQA